MMNKITLTIFLLVSFRGHPQYVFKFKEPKDFLTDIQQGPNPEWSPDGRKFALISNTKNRSKIAIIDTSDWSIEFINGAQNSFQWSHDGQSIVYTAKDESGLLKIFIYNLRNKASVKISHNSNSSDLYPSIAPGDSIITYHNCKAAMECQLYYADTNKGIAQKLIDDPSAEYLYPNWSPSGKLFLYWKAHGKEVIVEIIEIRTGRKVLIMSADEFDFKDWSMDEQEILCDYEGKLLKIRLLDGLMTEVSSSVNKILDAKWSPNGNLITFDADGAIYVVNSNGENQRKIYDKGFDPNWHPSGEKIIFVKDEIGYPIYEIDISGLNLRLLYNGRNIKKHK